VCSYRIADRVLLPDIRGYYQVSIPQKQSAGDFFDEVFRGFS
jgi:hypothetical protein